MLQAKNIFTSYELRGSEELEAAILPLLNQAHIQNKLAALALAKVNLMYDPEHPLKFQQEEAELHGQIKILQLLIDESNEAQQIITNTKLANPED